ncbi:hypothetical protein E2562_033778 [Oryza meyeriana var. granulata]|uniref:COBRA C-terminal domain-containing protein n=1 Tax=Oryza meyeriana var. granulata TaxID=110450 RepID=A0A6G1C1E6_9ORYZ|nr:hypothetical protein E2562_033778 [Oryza meyeriana var. granulata]
MEVDQLILFVFVSCLSSRFAGAYDPVDPNGNIIINWDFQSIENVYTVMVSIHNHQLYRHIEQPGWRLSWRWAGDEIIWGMTGAEATEQGDCHRIRGATRPHCCEKQPVIVDLPPGTPYNNQVANCCRGGVLSSLTQNNRTSTAAFQMVVGSFKHVSYHDGARGPALPSRFGIGVPGYSCSNATKVNATSESEKPELPAGDGEAISPVFRCTDHMCPVRVHWHVKISYREYWRVKVTITNYNLVKNYSNWNLVVQHPNLRSLTQLFSFNYQPLIQYGTVNNTGIFWGIQYYNEMLLQDGNVQTEMILRKDKGDFTFSGGWAFPRRVYFDGHECVMPPPDQYPLLPNRGLDSRISVAQWLLMASSCLLSLSIFLIV